MRSFLDTWRTGEGHLAFVPFVWLEFDLANAPGRFSPFVFACVQPRFLMHTMRTDDDADRCTRIALSALWAMSPSGLPPAVVACVTKLIRELPPGGHLLHVAAVETNRSPDGVAVRVVFSVPRAALLDFLGRVDWPGSADALLDAIGWLELGSGLIGFHLDILDELSSSIHLQLFRRPSPEEAPRWKQSFDSLIARGFCDERKARAIQAWPGLSREAYPGFEWPVRLRRGVELKLTLRETGALEAKAYLGFTPSFAL